MSEKIIVITPNDTIELQDYTDYKSLQQAVNGMIERFHSDRLPIGAGGLKIDLFCNEEFLLIESEEFNKVNAVASLMSGQEIRGNVAVTVYAGDGESRGFEYKEAMIDGEMQEDICECWVAEDLVMRYIAANRSALKELHDRLDNNKSEPYFEITSWDSKDRGDER